MRGRVDSLHTAQYNIDMDKQCAKCKRTKKAALFSKEPAKKYGLSSYCRVCLKEYMRARRNVQKTKVDEIKGVPCADCGGSFPTECMDFDHVRGKKLYNISQMYALYKPWAVLKKEIDKCDIVCSNCHRIRSRKGVKRRLGSV